MWNLFIGPAEKCVRRAFFTEWKRGSLNQQLPEDYREKQIQHEFAVKLFELFEEDMKKDLKKEEFQDRIEYRYRMVVMSEKEFVKFINTVIEETSIAIKNGLTVDKIKGGIIE